MIIIHVHTAHTLTNPSNRKKGTHKATQTSEQTHKLYYNVVCSRDDRNRWNLEVWNISWWQWPSYCNAALVKKNIYEFIELSLPIYNLTLGIRSDFLFLFLSLSYHALCPSILTLNRFRFWLYFFTVCSVNFTQIGSTNFVWGGGL